MPSKQGQYFPDKVKQLATAGPPHEMMKACREIAEWLNKGPKFRVALFTVDVMTAISDESRSVLLLGAIANQLQQLEASQS